MSYRGDFRAFVLAWVEVHGATSAEAAARVGVKSGTIRTWKRRALQKPPKPPHKDRPTLYPPCAIGAEALALHATGLTWVEVSSRMGLDYTSVYYRAVVKPRRPRWSRMARPPKKTREEKNARDRAYRARNRDIILERDRRRHAANRESERARKRQRYLANRDAILAADKARKSRRLYGPEWGSVHRALCDLRAAIKERPDK